MASRDGKVRKRARKARNAAALAELLRPKGEPRRRWQGSVSFQFGKDPRTCLPLTFSGVRVPVDLLELNHMDGVVELTELALHGASDGPN
jgi:hypothetical protein